MELIKHYVAPLRLGLLITAFLAGVLADGCGPEWREFAEMEYICARRAPSCRGMCETISRECVSAEDWDSCPANVWGLDVLACEQVRPGTPLDLGCDDPLPYRTDESEGFDYFACCCKYSGPYF
jgi:hypothetical protein